MLSTEHRHYYPCSFLVISSMSYRLRHYIGYLYGQSVASSLFFFIVCLYLFFIYLFFLQIPVNFQGRCAYRVASERVPWVSVSVCGKGEGSGLCWAVSDLSCGARWWVWASCHRAAGDLLGGTFCQGNESFWHPNGVTIQWINFYESWSSITCIFLHI